MGMVHYMLLFKFLFYSWCQGSLLEGLHWGALLALGFQVIRNHQVQKRNMKTFLTVL